MLDSSTAWSKVTEVGNPTWPTDVNRIVRGMKEIEATRRGKPSQARQPPIPAKFEAIIEALGTHKELEVST